jgi:lysozyme family protein
MLPAPPEQFFVIDVLRRMQKAEDFRKHVQECRALARRARSPADRGMLLDMAQTWEELAAARVAQIARRERTRGIAAALIPSIV